MNAKINEILHQGSRELGHIDGYFDCKAQIQKLILERVKSTQSLEILIALNRLSIDIALELERPDSKRNMNM